MSELDDEQRAICARLRAQGKPDLVLLAQQIEAQGLERWLISRACLVAQSPRFLEAIRSGGDGTCGEQ